MNRRRGHDSTIRLQIQPLVRPQHLHGRWATLDDLVIMGDQRAFQFTGQRDVVRVRAAKQEPSSHPRSRLGQRQIHLPKVELREMAQARG